MQSSDDCYVLQVGSSSSFSEGRACSCSQARASAEVSDTQYRLSWGGFRAVQKLYLFSVVYYNS